MQKLNLITNSLWKMLYECFFIHFGENPSRYEKLHLNMHAIEYIENKTNRFEVIIHYLTEKYGGNVVDKGIVKLTSSSIFDNYIPRNAVDFQSISCFSTTVKVDKSNAWLKFDFLNSKVQPTYYSIQSFNNSVGYHHLKSWVIEGSNSDRNDDWKILDSRINESCLNDRLAENTFKIQNDLKKK